MSAFEDALRRELSWLVRAEVTPRTVRLTVRELMVAQMARGPLGPRVVEDSMVAAVRAACRLVEELDAPDALVELVCGAALEAVRGHGGETARWLGEAAGAADAVLDEMIPGRPWRRVGW